MRVSPLFHLISDQLLFIRLINYSINCENLLQKKRKERKEGTVKKVSTTNLERRNLERERSLDRTTFNPPGVENSKAITNHDSSYPLRKWAVRSYWTHRSGDTLPLSLSDFWRWATRFPGFDFFVSFTVGRDTACRGNDTGVVPAKLAGQERKLDRTRGMERDACVSRSRVHWPEIILACRAVVPRRPLRYPLRSTDSMLRLLYSLHFSPWKFRGNQPLPLFPLGRGNGEMAYYFVFCAWFFKHV